MVIHKYFSSLIGFFYHFDLYPNWPYSNCASAIPFPFICTSFFDNVEMLRGQTYIHVFLQLIDGFLCVLFFRIKDFRSLTENSADS